MSATNGKCVTFNPLTFAGLNEFYPNTAVTTGSTSPYSGGIAVIVSGAPPLSKVIEYCVDYTIEAVPAGSLAITNKP